MSHYVLYLSILLAWVGQGFAFDEKYNPDVSTWKLVRRTELKSEDGYNSQFLQANHSDHDWSVKLVSGKVIARLRGEAIEEKVTLPPFETLVKIQGSEARAYRAIKVEDGWIVAYNLGEFGAAVYWYSVDGKKRQKLSGHQINHFILEGGRIFAVEGLAHLGGSRGSMIEIQMKEGEWSVNEFLILPGEPSAIARVAEGEFIIVTSNALLRVNLKKEKTFLISNAEWGILYPNSIVVNDSLVYVGMRQFVVRYDLRSFAPRYDLLVPDLKWLNVTK